MRAVAIVIVVILVFWWFMRGSGHAVARLHHAEPLIINTLRVVTLHVTDNCKACDQFMPIWRYLVQNYEKRNLRGIVPTFIEVAEPRTMKEAPDGSKYCDTVYPRVSLISERGRYYEYESVRGVGALLEWIYNPTL